VNIPTMKSENEELQYTTFCGPMHQSTFSC